MLHVCVGVVVCACFVAAYALHGVVCECGLRLVCVGCCCCVLLLLVIVAVYVSVYVFVVCCCCL